jgi:hypothetical protein
MTKLFRTIAFGVPTILLLATFAANAAAQPFVYAARRGTNLVAAYNINLLGGLTPIPGSPFAAG